MLFHQKGLHTWLRLLTHMIAAFNGHQMTLVIIKATRHPSQSPSEPLCWPSDTQYVFIFEDFIPRLRINR